MGKKGKVKKVLKFHQHGDIGGNIFGRSHPITMIHKNKLTQIRHKITLLIGEKEKILTQNNLNKGEKGNEE